MSDILIRGMELPKNEPLRLVLDDFEGDDDDE